MVCGLLASLCSLPWLLQPPRQLRPTQGFWITRSQTWPHPGELGWWPGMKLRPTQGFLDHTVPDLASPGGAGLVAGHESLNHLVGGTGYGHLTVTQPQRLCPSQVGPGGCRGWVHGADWALGLASPPSQHMEPWLQSDKSHEHKRVVQTIFLLLKYVVDYVTLTVSGLDTQHPRRWGTGGQARVKGGARSPQGAPASVLDPAQPPLLTPTVSIHRASGLLGTVLGDKTKALRCPQSWGRGHSSDRAVGDILTARLPGRKDLKEDGEGDWVVEGGHSRRGKGAGQRPEAWPMGRWAQDGRTAGGQGHAWGEDICMPGRASVCRPPQEEATPSLLGHQIGLLALLWRDKDPVTRSHSHQCIYLLLQLLIQQKGEWGAPPPGDRSSRPPDEVPSTGSTEQFMHLDKMKNFEAKARRESERKFYNVVKVGLSELQRGGAAGPPTAPEQRPDRCPQPPTHSTAYAGGRARGARPRTSQPPTCDLEVRQGPLSQSRALADVCPLGTHSPVASLWLLTRATSASAGTDSRSPPLPFPPWVRPSQAGPLPSRCTRSQGFGFESELRLQQLGCSTLPHFGFPAVLSEGHWA